MFVGSVLELENCYSWGKLDLDNSAQHNNKKEEADFDMEFGNYKGKGLDRSNDCTKNFDCW